MKKTFKETSYNNMPIIRIAPVCNGKIYVVPHQSSLSTNCLFDIPIQEEVTTDPSPTGKAALKLKERYRSHIDATEQPRFSVKYRLKSSERNTVYLYILPLEKEEDIHFSNGLFITAEDIQVSGKNFSPYLLEESELLGMAAELWSNFYRKNEEISASI